MKQTINKSAFRDAFRACDRQDQFSYAAIGTLFNYLEELEQDTGEDYELDVIALCCDFSEQTLAELRDNWSDLSADHDDDEEFLDELREHVSPVIAIGNGAYIVGPG